MQQIIVAPTHTLLAIIDRNSPRTETVFNFSEIDSDIIIDNITHLSLNNDLSLEYDEDKIKKELKTLQPDGNIFLVNTNKENTKYMTLEILPPQRIKFLVALESEIYSDILDAQKKRDFKRLERLQNSLIYSQNRTNQPSPNVADLTYTRIKQHTERIMQENRRTLLDVDKAIKETVPTPLRVDVRQEVRAEREAEKKQKPQITRREFPLMFYIKGLKETDADHEDYPYSNIDVEYWTNTERITAHQHYFDDADNYEGTRIFSAVDNPITYLDTRNGVEYSKIGISTSEKQIITNADTLEIIRRFWQDIFLCSNECTEEDKARERKKARLRNRYPTAADEMIKLLKLGI